VRLQILVKEKSPRISEAVAMVRIEESRRGINARNSICGKLSYDS